MEEKLEPLIKTLLEPCIFLEICQSPSRSKKWACMGYKTNEDRLLMCATFNRLSNGPIEKPEALREKEWIGILKRQIHANQDPREGNRR